MRNEISTRGTNDFVVITFRRVSVLSTSLLNPSTNHRVIPKWTRHASTVTSSNEIVVPRSRRCSIAGFCNLLRVLRSQRRFWQSGDAGLISIRFCCQVITSGIALVANRDLLLVSHQYFLQQTSNSKLQMPNALIHITQTLAWVGWKYSHFTHQDRHCTEFVDRKSLAQNFTVRKTAFLECWISLLYYWQLLA